MAMSTRLVLFHGRRERVLPGYQVLLSFVPCVRFPWVETLPFVESRMNTLPSLCRHLYSVPWGLRRKVVGFATFE